MPVSEQKLREYFAKNLSTYRKALGITQLELAEKLNYSDKSISKWERGDGLPDLTVTAQLADIFGLTVNDLIAEKPRRRFLSTRNKTIITLLSIGVAWLIASILFFLFQLVAPSFSSWLFFIYAIPTSSIIAIVFSAVWWKKIHLLLSVSLLIWSLAVCIVVSLSISSISLIFIVAAVLQILTILWFLIKKQ